MPAKKASKIIVAPEEAPAFTSSSTNQSASPATGSSEPSKKAIRVELEDGSTKKVTETASTSATPRAKKEQASVSKQSAAASTAAESEAAELEEGVTLLVDDAAAKQKAAEQKEANLLKQGEQLSGEALRKFMMDQFLNFDDDPVSDIEKILGGF